jgi:hypothetical protein
MVKLSAAGNVKTFRAISVSGSPAGTAELKGDNYSLIYGRVRADATRASAAAGSIVIGELTDPPAGAGLVAVWEKVTARSRDGPAGSVTFRDCYVNTEVLPYVAASGGKQSGGGQILIQSRNQALLPQVMLARGPGARIRVEYVTQVMPGELASPEPELFQYPNPGCDCTMSFAQCMQAP